MAGVKTMLQEAANNDKKQTQKATSKTGGKNTVPKVDTEPINDISLEEPTRDSSPEKSEVPSKKKNPGGRPTNKEKGIKSRKQYTLTLKEDTYNLILAKAREDDLSFAKFMERAALDYIDRHN